MTLKSQLQFFESILYRNGDFPFLIYHYERLNELAAYSNKKFSQSLEELNEYIYSQIPSLKYAYKCKLNLNLGDTEIELGQIDFQLIDSNEFNHHYPIDLCVYPTFPKPNEKYNLFKFESKLLYSHSIDYAKSQNCHQSIIINTKRELVETSFCTLFLINNQQIYTPKLESGGVNGVLRRWILSRLKVEESSIHIDQLKEFESAFVSNAIRGIIPVKTIEGRVLDLKYPFEIDQIFP